MELTVLGKYGPYPKANGACSGYLVQNREEYLLLDMGSGVLERLLQYIDIRQLKHIFISHLHFDHTSDLLPLRYLLEDVDHSVNIYTHYEESEWYKILFSHPHFRVIGIDEKAVITTDTMQLSFVKMVHGATDYAVRIAGDKTLCYTGDTACHDGLEACFTGCDYILADCSKPAGFKASHMTVEDARRLQKQYGCRIIATHQSPDYNPQDAFSDSENILSAEEMKTYSL